MRHGEGNVFFATPNQRPQRERAHNAHETRDLSASRRTTRRRRGTSAPAGAQRADDEQPQRQHARNRRRPATSATTRAQPQTTSNLSDNRRVGADDRQPKPQQARDQRPQPQQAHNPQMIDNRSRWRPGVLAAANPHLTSNLARGDLRLVTSGQSNWVAGEITAGLPKDCRRKSSPWPSPRLLLTLALDGFGLGLGLGLGFRLWTWEPELRINLRPHGLLDERAPEVPHEAAALGGVVQDVGEAVQEELDLRVADHQGRD